MLKLYAKALMFTPTALNEHTHANALINMPTTQLHEVIQAKPDHCQTYNKLTQWQPTLAALMHPNYLQTLSLPMQLALMVEPSFPFKPMGLVHFANSIEVKCLPEQNQALNIKTFFGLVYYHPKGWMFEVITEAHRLTADKNKCSNDDSRLVKAISYYLARTKHCANKQNELIALYPTQPTWIQNKKLSAHDIAHIHQAPINQFKKSEVLQFASNIGRQYAKISGDYNPIHLHAASARLWGFKKAIAHGMYSKALVLSKIARDETYYKNAFKVYTQFSHAIELPEDPLLTFTSKKANTETGRLESDIEFAVNSQTKEHIHLLGNISY